MLTVLIVSQILSWIVILGLGIALTAIGIDSEHTRHQQLDQRTRQQAGIEPAHHGTPVMAAYAAGNGRRSPPANPTTGKIQIDGTLFSGRDFELAVYNACGKMILQQKNSRVIDFSPFGKGIYFLTIKSASGEKIGKKIVVI